MSHYQACLLCGAEGPQVRIALVEWIDPEDGKPFAAIPRCSDVPGCRSRVELEGESWPITETKGDAA